MQQPLENLLAESPLSHGVHVAQVCEEELRLPAWEDALVKHPGLNYIRLKLIWTLGMLHALLRLQNLNKFARQLGLLKEDDVPTQAHGGTIRAQGVVQGVTLDLPIIKIEYQIKGDTL
ncbi:hypothetical protein WJX77_010333 [Trebouxia sp. C0004]